jgi:DNA polymerase delta subunit 1
MVRTEITLISYSSIVGVDVMSFDTERGVLLAWRDFIREVDPEIVIGYNIIIPKKHDMMMPRSRPTR